MTTPGQVPVESLNIDGHAYNAAYIPLVINGTPLGVLGVYRVDDTLYATWLSREWIGSLVAAALVGMVVLVTFVVVGRFAGPRGTCHHARRTRSRRVMRAPARACRRTTRSGN